MICGEYHNFPVRTRLFREATHLSYRPFWAILNQLKRHGIIELPYGPKSPWFTAGFPGLTPAITADVRRKLTSAEKADVALTSAEKADVVHTPNMRMLTGGNRPNIRQVGVSKPSIRQVGGSTAPVVVAVDLNKAATTVTNADVAQALQGPPLECLNRWFKDFKPGLLYTAFQDAFTFAPENPVARLRGSVFYFDDARQRGQKFKNPLGAIRGFVRSGAVLEEMTVLSKEGGLNAKTEEAPEPPKISYGTVEEALFAGENLARTCPDFETFKSRIQELFGNHPHWPEIAPKLEDFKVRLKFKKEA